jgi:hypothetical protein
MHFVRYLLAGCIFAAFSMGITLAAPISPSQTSAVRGPGLVLKVQSRCETLRRECEMKNELGERGEGNCRRYHYECGFQRGASDCARLRSDCLYKREQGERGEGNCRRYREECGGQR